MQIDVSKIKNIKGGSASFQLEECLTPAAAGYSELALSTPVRFAGTVSNADGLLLVEGQVEGVLELVCNRCLQPFSQRFSLPLNAAFSNKPELVTEEEDAVVYPFEGNELDMTACVLNEIYLSLPMQVVCREDCRGLCPGCGVDLNQEACRCTEINVDPRLEKLLQFNNQGKGV